MKVMGKQDIVGFEIPVYIAHFVHVIHCTNYLMEIGSGDVFIKPSHIPDIVYKWSTLKILHNHRPYLLFLSIFMCEYGILFRVYDFGDVWMLE